MGSCHTRQRPVSWIFSFLLACYVLVRIVLRVRGQLRYLSVRESLPVPPPSVAAAPEHLGNALAGFYVDTRVLRIALVEARRMLMTVAVTDPDAALGRVRDARYRRALMQSFSDINRWLRGIREFDDHVTMSLSDLHLGGGSVEQLRDGLRGRWQAVSRARPLDLFPLEDVLAVQRTLELLDDELAAIERGLERHGDDPYRDRANVWASEAL
jgi:hypothetical protein